VLEMSEAGFLTRGSLLETDQRHQVHFSWSVDRLTILVGAEYVHIPNQDFDGCTPYGVFCTGFAEMKDPVPSPRGQRDRLSRHYAVSVL
jgi:hypothetical protein